MCMRTYMCVRVACAVSGLANMAQRVFCGVATGPDHAVETRQGKGALELAFQDNIRATYAYIYTYAMHIHIHHMH